MGNIDNSINENNIKENISKNNIINAIIKIENNNFEQYIINSYENWRRENPDEYDWNKDSIKAIPNEKQIKSCEIFINDNKINFTYLYSFPNNGNFKIKYIFKDVLTSINFLFYKCRSIISLDFSEFNSSRITNMGCAFSFCNSLKNKNLSNFNTTKVTNMRFLFHNCNSLLNLDISHFDTSKVTNMEYMFFKCISLNSIELSNFDTKNVKNMECMFYSCYSLINLDLSNFDFNKVY